MADYLFADQFILDTGTTRDFYVRFLKGLVHKSNNLVGVIQGFGSLILMEDKLDPGTRDSFQQMDSAARTMNELNKRILTAGGCAAVNCSPVSLSAMFDFFESKAKDYCQKHGGMELNFIANPGIPSVMVDSNRFSEVFLELLKNAVESAAETERRAISIEFYAPQAASATGRVDVFIRNTCPDIDPQRMGDMFQCFHGSKGGDHFGIGLKIAAVLCGQMDIRLGLQYEDRRMSAWLSIPVA